MQTAQVKPWLWPAYPYQAGLDATDRVLLTFFHVTPLNSHHPQAHAG
jgi:hypothetical protein